MHRTALTASMFWLFSLVAPDSRAGNVTVVNMGLDEGNTTSLLEATSQYYVDAMHSLINERYKDEYRAIRWELLETSMKDAQVARLEYRFEVNGETRIRIYHAQGGRPLDALARSIFDGPTPAVTPGSPSGLSDEEWADSASTADAADMADYAAMDAGDSVFYTGFSETNVRARILPHGSSVLESFHIDGANRAMDPEFKALRAIENDLQANVIPRGGNIRGILGGATCGSCRHAMQRLADAYGMDIRLTQMFGSLPRDEREALIASGKAKLRGRQLVSSTGERPLLARDVLVNAREQQVKRSLNPSSLNRSFKGLPWRPRSFRLRPVHVAPTRETAAGDETRPLNSDTTELPPPQC